VLPFLAGTESQYYPFKNDLVDLIYAIIHCHGRMMINEKEIRYARRLLLSIITIYLFIKKYYDIFTKNLFINNYYAEYIKSFGSDQLLE